MAVDVDAAISATVPLLGTCFVAEADSAGEDCRFQRANSTFCSLEIPVDLGGDPAPDEQTLWSHSLTCELLTDPDSSVEGLWSRLARPQSGGGVLDGLVPIRHCG